MASSNRKKIIVVQFPTGALYRQLVKSFDNFGKHIEGLSETGRDIPMVMTLDNLTLMLPEQRRLLRLRKSQRRRGPYEKRPLPGRDELLNYLRNNHVRSVRQLMKHRRPTEPRPWHYYRAFGSWRKAKEECFGPEPPPAEAPVTHGYCIKVCEEFSIWTQERWLEARRKRPDVVPSANQVRRLFGTFSNLFAIAERQSFIRTLEKYLRLEQKLAHRPSAEECRREGLDLTACISFFGSKSLLDRFLDDAHAAQRKQQQGCSSKPPGSGVSHADPMLASPSQAAGLPSL